MKKVSHSPEEFVPTVGTMEHVSSTSLTEVFGTLDLKAFTSDLEKLGREIASTLSYDDFLHLRKIERRGRLATCLGLATAWLFPNPLSAFLISFGNLTRWGLAHHILHRGYDKVPEIPKNYTSQYFARGWRRYLDWFDWMIPEGWEYEHNILHHYHTGEDEDPDLVERYIEFLREAKIPKFLKYVYVFISGITWKFGYYALNTTCVIDPQRLTRLKKEHIVFVTILNIFDFRNQQIRKLWSACYFPYAFFHFVLIPLCFLPLGTTASCYVLLNMMLAELMTNLHSFLIIAPNHAGEDLSRFDFHFEDKQEFFLTQVLGSANYNCGNDFIDHMQIWLNYQIEHHLYPNLPMTKYRELQPQVKAICQLHGVPYIQESVFVRAKKMVAICVGNSSMIRVSSREALRERYTG